MAEQPTGHHAVIEDVLARASQTVEVRIAQFRAFLAIFLLVVTLQTLFFTGSRVPARFLVLALSVSLMALLFSLLVIWADRWERGFPITTVAILSIGLDAALLALPVTLFVSTPETTMPLVRSADQLLNQPTVFAMYLLVIASGLRFRDAAKLGIAVNGLVILAMMGIEAVQAQGPTGVAPEALFTIRQHFLLLLCSGLLAWLISTHLRSTTLMAANAALHATIDSLTGVYNRHYLRNEFDRLTAQREGTIHLLMVDVDHFKAINDELGHGTGDIVLKEVARRLQDSLRTHDLVARYGGEEFCVLLHGLDDPTAHQVAERLRQSVAKEPIEERVVTVSIGVAQWEQEEEVSSVLERADICLYRAKESGRDRVVSA